MVAQGAIHDMRLGSRGVGDGWTDLMVFFAHHSSICEIINEFPELAIDLARHTIQLVHQCQQGLLNHVIFDHLSCSTMKAPPSL